MARDAGEVARQGAVAYLDLNRDAVQSPGEPTAVSDSFGDALFDGLAPGTYAERVVVPELWHLSAPAAGFADVTPGTISAAATFALAQVASVSGTLTASRSSGQTAPSRTSGSR
jgi:hypothetical protein